MNASFSEILNLPTYFLVTSIRCKALQEKCLNLLSRDSCGILKYFFPLNVMMLILCLDHVVTAVVVVVVAVGVKL